MLKIRQIVTSVSRFVFVWFILISAFVFAMFQGGVVSWTIFYAILPFVFYSTLLFFYPMSAITVQRTLQSSTLQSGEKLKVRLLLKRKFRFPLLYMVVQEDFGSNSVLKEKGELKKILNVGMRKEMIWNYELSEMPRGEHVLGGVKIEVMDFFGWMKKTHFIPVTNKIVVYPKTIPIDYVATESHYELGSAIVPYPIVADTTIAAGIRDYQSGDRMSWIHWKSFARTQTLMTKEFENRRSQDISIVFDRQSSDAFEERVEFAASIVQEALRRKVSINFISLGIEPIVFHAIQAEAEYKEVFTHLASVMPDEQRSFIQVKENVEQVGSLLLLTSNPDWSLLKVMRTQVQHDRQLICFVILSDEHALRGKIASDISFARSKGIIIRTLTRAHFAKAFREVAHS